jgi:hypothetical protein
MNQDLIAIKKTCPACNGYGLIETGQTYTLVGRVHQQLAECTACEKNGYLIEWVDLHQFTSMLQAIRVEEEAQ